MATIFTRIVKGEIPAYKVAEDDNYLAFLDVNPLTKGHTLVIPKKEVDYIFDLEDSDYLGLFFFARKVAAAVEKSVSCLRIGIAVVGLEVPHAHIHLVPLHHMGDIDFNKTRVKLTPEEFKALAETISSNFKAS